MYLSYKLENSEENLEAYGKRIFLPLLDIHLVPLGIPKQPIQSIQTTSDCRLPILTLPETLTVRVCPMVTRAERIQGWLGYQGRG
jgi:hypothetical protein